jgi:hypothetical protein
MLRSVLQLVVTHCDVLVVVVVIDVTGATLTYHEMVLQRPDALHSRAVNTRI